MMLKTINRPKIEFCECGTSKAQAMFAHCMRENRSEIVLCPYCEQPMRANPPTQGESTMKEIIDRAYDIECVTKSDAKAVAALADLAVQLQSRLESLEKDAARYRWLRLALADREKGVSHYFCSVRYSEELDEAIDTAMQTNKG